MAKQGKAVPGKETFMRMNYLHQASELMAEIAVNSSNPESKECAEFTSRYYSNLLINVAKKNVLRIDTGIKRYICKGCRSRMIPGDNARVRLRKKPEKHLRWTCLKCNTSRTYNSRKDYCVWSERPEALVELLEFGNDDDIGNQSQSKESQ